MMADFIDTVSIRAALHRDERQNDALRKFLYLMPTVLWVKDYTDPERGGVYVLVSREWEYSIGRKRDQVVGFTDYDFLPKDEARRAQENDRLTLEAQKQTTVVDGIGTRYNGFRPMRIALVPFSVCGEERLTHVGGFVTNQETRTL